MIEGGDEAEKVVEGEGVEGKHGRIHGYPSRGRAGRGSDGDGDWGIWAGEVSSKRLKTPKKRGRTDKAGCRHVAREKKNYKEE